MNALTQALKSAGVTTPPQSQRVWQFLKDNDRSGVGRTSEDVAKALGLSYSCVSSLITNMGYRGMVSYKEHVSLKHKGRKVRYYRAEGHRYELQPKPHKKQPGEPTPVAPAPVEPATTEPVEPKRIIFMRKRINVDDLTVGEARELYLALKGMFA